MYNETPVQGFIVFKAAGLNTELSKILNGSHVTQIVDF
jgi:hypothetical protein